MKTFTISDLEIDIRRHVRVDGSRFPVPSPDYVADYFVITARWQGNAIDFYPNQGKLNDPLAVGWIGKKVVPVYENQGTEDDPIWVQIGTKRGADFRTRMFKMFAHRLGKAVLARQLGKTIGQVTEADMRAVTAPRLRAALHGTFTDPVDLKQFDLDDACRHLRDAAGELEAGTKPPGTVANIDCDFDSCAGSTGFQFETNTTVFAGGIGGVTYRIQWRFPLGAIAGASAVNDSSIQWNVTAETLETDETGDIHAYNGTGDDDPDPDSAATKYSRSVGGTALVTGLTTEIRSTGSYTIDLGTTADGQILGNISSPAIYSLALALTTATTNDQLDIEAIENAGTDPATLIVDYTAAAVGTTPFLAMMGVGT